MKKEQIKRGFTNGINTMQAIYRINNMRILRFIACAVLAIVSLATAVKVCDLVSGAVPQLLTSSTWFGAIVNGSVFIAIFLAVSAGLWLLVYRGYASFSMNMMHSSIRLAESSFLALYKANKLDKTEIEEMRKAIPTINKVINQKPMMMTIAIHQQVLPMFQR